MDILEKVKTTYNQLDKNNLERLGDIYDEQIVFIDPFHRIEGLSALKDYFSGMYENINHIRFEYTDEIASEGKAALYWKMYFSHPKLKGGQDIEVHGTSHFEFKEKLIRHRDYFDGAEMLYEHVPLLGSGIRWIKQRL